MKLKQRMHHLTHFHQTFPEGFILSVSCEHLHARVRAHTRSISKSILPGKGCKKCLPNLTSIYMFLISSAI